jgi:hypothetical protein
MDSFVPVALYYFLHLTMSTVLKGVDDIVNVDPDMFRLMAEGINKGDVATVTDLLPSISQLSAQLMRMCSCARNLVNDGLPQIQPVTGNPGVPPTSSGPIQTKIQDSSKTEFQERSRSELDPYHSDVAAVYTRNHTDVDQFVSHVEQL